jgi:hypothetical protein
MPQRAENANDGGFVRRALGVQTYTLHSQQASTRQRPRSGSPRPKGSPPGRSPKPWIAPASRKATTHAHVSTLPRAEVCACRKHASKCPRVRRHVLPSGAPGEGRDALRPRHRVPARTDHSSQIPTTRPSRFTVTKPRSVSFLDIKLYLRR